MLPYLIDVGFAPRPWTPMPIGLQGLLGDVQVTFSTAGYYPKTGGSLGGPSVGVPIADVPAVARTMASFIETTRPAIDALLSARQSS